MKGLELRSTRRPSDLYLGPPSPQDQLVVQVFVYCVEVNRIGTFSATLPIREASNAAFKSALKQHYLTMNWSWGTLSQQLGRQVHLHFYSIL